MYIHTYVHAQLVVWWSEYAERQDDAYLHHVATSLPVPFPEFWAVCFIIIIFFFFGEGNLGLICRFTRRGYVDYMKVGYKRKKTEGPLVNIKEILRLIGACTELGVCMYDSPEHRLENKRKSENVVGYVPIQTALSSSTSTVLPTLDDPRKRSKRASYQ
jgi:hypothetical protein